MKQMKQFAVLIATDNVGMFNVLKDFLQDEGFQIYQTCSGEEMLQLLATWNPDIVILDIMLPDRDGWEILARVKTKSDMPVIVIGEKDKEQERLRALETGAEDYLTRPFNCREMAERIKIILRLINRGSKSAGLLRVGDLVIDPLKCQASYRGNEIELTLTEFRILELLATHSQQVLNRMDIIDKVRGKAFKGNVRTIDTHIGALRCKLTKQTGKSNYIQTVHGVGYRLASGREM